MTAKDVLSNLPKSSSPALLEAIRRQWHAQTEANGDLWVFGYASLIWRPEFEFIDRRAARVVGWHRALNMWSTLNRGNPACPGLVFALLSGGSCQGVAFRIAAAQASQALDDMWFREMPGDVYEPRWLRCHTPQGTVNALTFTLPRSSLSYSGTLTAERYRQIFSLASGRYGTTLDYALRTFDSLQAEGIHDRALQKLLGEHVRK